MNHSHIVVLDSRDRDYSSYPAPEEYTLRLPKVYKRIAAARLLGIEVPLSFYVFSAARGNTTLRINDVDVTLPDGNYSATSIGPALDKALLAAFPSETFSVTMDLATMKVSLSNASTAITLDTSSAIENGREWGLAYHLGFSRDAVYTVPPAAQLTSPGVVNLFPQTYLLLDIPELNGIDESALDGGEVGKGCFAKIPFTVDTFRFVTLDLSNAPMVFQTPPKAKVDRVSVTWRWHDGTVVDFNGAEHSMTLQLFFEDEAPPPVYAPRNPGNPTVSAPEAETARVVSIPRAPEKVIPSKSIGGIWVLVALFSILLGGVWWWNSSSLV